MLDLKNINPLVRQIAEEKDLPVEKVFEALENALAAAYKKEYGNKNQIIRCKIDPETGDTNFYRVFLVVDESMIKKEEEENVKEKTEEDQGEKTENKILVRFNPERHLMIEEALKINPNAKVGEELLIPLETKMEFSRIAAQTAKQVILQKLKEIERKTIIEEFKEKEGKIVSGVIQRIDKKYIYVDLGKTIGLMPVSEGIPGEYYKVGERRKFYLLKLEEKKGSPVIYLSRSHPKFVSKLFELEVPEIANGIVEIKSIAREPGQRTKIAVVSNNENVDPVGACVGQKGTRVAVIIEELKGEKIDIIPYSEEPTKYVSYALGPAKVKEAEVISEKREVRVFLDPDQISLAIGKNGQNVRLAAKLTGWRIDVRSILNPQQTVEGGVADSSEEPAQTSEETSEETIEKTPEETSEENIEEPSSEENKS
ncbi:MAG: transcription termination factor NusA [Candidatus Paceibacterota bacterium]